ncbi:MULTISPECIES: DUF6157 family protein [Brevibacillus]|jgi:hypothetical protein|uniref:DUF6157 family protein n=1 Tax=Brevibacillus TaxID=55080 RepID=UPI000468F4FB|nr:DUF6157 family protein [Brevibacillus borstelensis]MBE5395731.1 hypothetical protein [Brevibacillus borstelensis]MCC0566345.1 DUF6157 family protein [Brevibacillus borstelensis]MCM3593821.1 DUF6157 family protein [Brevibacillus borstelensis]MED1850824.1 DUF6157 family protein [Brevibacillus borstelensis]MED1873792.1 DUF6157 family protein [Brevibacillus borstelensis]
MDWNYFNTFITVAPDCPVITGIIPPEKKTGKSKHGIEYELISGAPYHYTQEELLFEVYVRHQNFPQTELAERGGEIRAEFFSKPKACMRASALPKKFGWGIHFNEAGKMALIPMESPQYAEYAQGANGTLKVLAAMRNRRAK